MSNFAGQGFGLLGYRLDVYSSVASRISKLWGIIPHSTEKCGGFEKNVGNIHLPYNMTYRKEFIYFTFMHF
jgi:hypothetical protein